MSKLLIKRLLFNSKFCVFLTKKYRLSEDAVLPTRATNGSAGYDLCSAKSIVVPAYGKALCLTDLAISCPYGTYGRIAARSGLAWKFYIDVGAGVIDQDWFFFFF